MQHVSSIAVGVGLSADGAELTPGTQAAVGQASWLARRLGARLLLLHSNQGERWFDPLIEGARGARGPTIVNEGVPPAGVALLEALLGCLQGEGCRVQMQTVDDAPAEALIRAAARGQADLVVVGRFDEGEDLHKLGSITAKLLRRCPCPVWAVRPDHVGRPATILAATDLTAVGTRAVRYAAWLAGETGAELHVVHFYEVPMSVQMAHGRAGESQHDAELERLEAAARAALAADLVGTSLGARLHLHVAHHSPSPGLKRAVEDLDPDLLVMGTVSRPGIAGLLIGSTAEHLLGRVPCSLLTLKPEGFEAATGAN